MTQTQQDRRIAVALFLLGATLSSMGCHAVQLHKPNNDVPAQAIPCDCPRELNKAILPTYMIEPPDILLIDAVRIVPRAPYHVRSPDSIILDVRNTLAEAPIQGVYPIEPGGRVNLGPPYGAVNVEGLTVSEIQVRVMDHLKQFLREPEVSVSLGELASLQQIAGEHLVGPDGRVTLGSYGSVHVVGMTVEQARQAIEIHLTQYLENPEISLNVFAYNSKVYYVITEGAGQGDGVFRFPVTGNETVLDAIAQLQGLGPVSSKKIWVARPKPGGCKDGSCDQILPVDWTRITACGDPATNYQLMPGDRVFVAEDKLIALDSSLAKIIAPFERVAGFSLLGVGVVTRFSGPVLRGGGNPNGTF
ncbi:Capsular polysaccharide biosynthesis [Planctomycetales bacterium 10988]|nr:Capsular polysaccharide biosynthesis [Planctomycetales bacterium 10988]